MADPRPAGGTRRQLLTALGVGVTGVAGCGGDDPNNGPARTDAERPVDDTATSPTATASGPPEFAVVGTRTGPGEDGIFTLRVGEDGSLERASAVDGGSDPSFLALDHAGAHLYAVDTIDEGAATAFTVDPDTGALERLNRVTVGGAAPAHCSVDRTDQCLLTAQYAGGNVSVLPITEDGSLEEPSTVLEHSGSGPNERRQSEPHPHSIQPGPTNAFVYAPDLGADRVFVYDFDPESATIEPAETGPVETAPGAGPRHMDFHPNGRYAYVINELDSTVVAYEYDPNSGGLEAIATVDTLGEDYGGSNTTADVHVHPSGEYLYGSNRGHNSIAIFEIDDGGRPEFVETESTRGEWPRNFAVDPSGTYLYAENERSDDIVPFSIEGDGTLEAIGERLELPSPVCMKFL